MSTRAKVAMEAIIEAAKKVQRLTTEYWRSGNDDEGTTISLEDKLEEAEQELKRLTDAILASQEPDDESL